MTEETKTLIEERNKKIREKKEEIKRLEAELKEISPPISIKRLVKERPFRWKTERVEGERVLVTFTNKDPKFYYNWEPYRMLCNDFFGNTRRTNQLSVEEMEYAAKMVNEMIKIYNAYFVMYYGDVPDEQQTQR